MNIVHEILAWFVLAIMTVSSWFYMPEFGGWSLVAFMTATFILMVTSGVKRLDKQEEGVTE